MSLYSLGKATFFINGRQMGKTIEAERRQPEPPQMWFDEADSIDLAAWSGFTVKLRDALLVPSDQFRFLRDSYAAAARPRKPWWRPRPSPRKRRRSRAQVKRAKLQRLARLARRATRRKNRGCKAGRSPATPVFAGFDLGSPPE